MRKVLNTLVIAVVALFAGTTLMAADDAVEIMKKSHLAYYYAADNGVANITMTIINKKGKERLREFVMLRIDLIEGGEQKYYTYFKKPSDVSRLTFMVWKNPKGNDDRWIYVPAVDLIKRISADDKNSSFVGSDFTYEDVSGRHWTEDTHTLVSVTETTGERATFLISSVPKESYKGFSEKKVWIDKVSYLPLREEYYDSKGKLLRVFTADKIETVEGVATITQRSMTNEKKKQHTTIVFDNIDYNTGVTDKIFTERYLKNPPRQYIK
ncbi:MAG: outer membrane lipoprotein-sorting protein [FCB group bacterium]|nr:outer membrane lipoprotein-sorting protein [FCB group bacterium]